MIDWGVVVGIIASVMAGLMYIGKRRADVLLLDAQTQLQKVQQDGSEFDQMMKLINRQAEHADKQLLINESFILSLEKKEKKDEDNYQTLKLVSDRHAQEHTDEVRFARDKIIERIELMPERIATILSDGLRTIAAENAVVMAEIVNKALNHYEGVVFPTNRDPRWREAYVHPRNGLTCLFDEPRVTELAKHITPDTCLRGEERMWVMASAQPGFHAVRRANGTYGYLQASAVIVVEISNHYPKVDVQEGDDEKHISSGNVDSGGSGAAGGDAAGVSGADAGGRADSGGNGAAANG